jgi:hypothetical protein
MDSGILTAILLLVAIVVFACLTKDSSAVTGQSQQHD